MNFYRDLLLVDLETTGLDSGKHEIIQLAGIILDKKTLKEKKSFSIFVKPKKWKNRDIESMNVNKIEWDQLKDAENIIHALQEFNSFLGDKKYTLTNYGGNLDGNFLQAAYKAHSIPYPFDYHVFNIWSLAYPFLASKDGLENKRKPAGFGMDDFAKKYHIKLEGVRHEALSDCRLEAEVLRKLMEKI